MLLSKHFWKTILGSVFIQLHFCIDLVAILVSHQAVLQCGGVRPTFYNKIASMSLCTKTLKISSRVPCLVLERWWRLKLLWAIMIMLLQTKNFYWDVLKYQNRHVEVATNLTKHSNKTSEEGRNHQDGKPHAKHCFATKSNIELPQLPIKLLRLALGSGVCFANTVLVRTYFCKTHAFWLIFILQATGMTTLALR